MNDRENARAAREARESAAERVSSHTAEQLAERAIKQYLLSRARDDQRVEDDKDK
ncbi:hypothetical protein [Amycolatopsis pithecellobii]|uniref:Uncharacterized protein n=1 Tax=Amycolatopsis pithecellobii TaxID=664692 RepID=A0A6N7Z597_9PSEU|nr:hypothetical protein [Amycolatopsis pithecellobii]MTD54586.1 hypothetical protein [Amycolatopsis pithecellobii]